MYFSTELEQILMHCCRMFSSGEFKADDQEKMLSVLNKKVEEVYRSCIGDNEANIRYVWQKGFVWKLTCVGSRISVCAESTEPINMLCIQTIVSFHLVFHCVFIVGVRSENAFSPKCGGEEDRIHHPVIILDPLYGNISNVVYWCFWQYDVKSPVRKTSSYWDGKQTGEVFKATTLFPMLRVSVKEFWKSINIWESYEVTQIWVVLLWTLKAFGQIPPNFVL